MFAFLPAGSNVLWRSKTNPGAREAQRTLAGGRHIHEEATRQAIAAAGALFGVAAILRALTRPRSTALDGVKSMASSLRRGGRPCGEAGMKAGLFKSISEARCD
ncbi:MAG: hypothetical protein ACLSUZ_04575 [Bifidobacterium pseudocatenulatum]